MLGTIKTAINAMLLSDPSVSAEQRAAFFSALSTPAQLVNALPRVVKRNEASKILGLGLKRIDQLARAGTLKRVTIPGCKRSIGFSEASIRAITEGGAVNE